MGESARACTTRLVLITYLMSVHTAVSYRNSHVCMRLEIENFELCMPMCARSDTEYVVDEGRDVCVLVEVRPCGKQRNVLLCKAVQVCTAVFCPCHVLA